MSRSDRVESLLRHMLQSARSKSATKKSLSKKSIVGGKAPIPKGFNRGPAAARWCNVRRIRSEGVDWDLGVNDDLSGGRSGAGVRERVIDDGDDDLVSFCPHLS